MIGDLALAADRLATTDSKRNERRYLADVARPIVLIDASMLISDLEVLLRDDSIHAVAVTDGDRIGLLTRTRYAEALTGRLGYGRAVHLRRRAGELADFKALSLPPHTSIADAATQAMARSRKRRYDPILVADTEWKAAQTGDVTTALVAALTARSMRDSLTGMPTRIAMVYDLTRRCEKAAGGKARIALILIRIRGLGKINATYGQAGGDAILSAVARKLIDQRAPGTEIGRISGRVFAVAMTLPTSDEVTITATVDATRERQLRELALGPSDIPASIWPEFDSGVAWTNAKVQSADDLMRTAEAQMRAARQQAGALPRRGT